MKHKPIKIVLVLLLILIIILTIIGEIPVVRNFKISSSKISENSTVKIVFLSDLHSCYYGKNQSQLVDIVNEANPDIVIFGGDFFDDKKSNTNSELLAKALAPLYPCYYASGNHECWSGQLTNMKNYLRSCGVTVLDGECSTIEVNGNYIDICGIDDNYLGDEYVLKQLNRAYKESNSEHFRILVSHRPSLRYIYIHYDFDMILCGHAHGGQWKIPFTQTGVYTPHDGFFPHYVDGEYKLNDQSTMYVSRGLARESLPIPRFFNPPDIMIFEISG